jgi:hypothetical protein
MHVSEELERKNSIYLHPGQAAGEAISYGQPEHTL